MRKSQELLLRLYHDPQYNFSQVKVEYINRGAPGDRSAVQGDQIHKLRAGGMEIESDKGEVYIPFHRILRLLYDGEIIWERGAGKNSTNPERRSYPSCDIS